MKAKNIILGSGVILGLLLPSLQASEWDKKTIITIQEPMEIPGMVLPAGEYVIKRADESLPNVIQFTNPEETEVLATVQALPTIRQKPSEKVEIVAEERPTGSPEALKKWFYPGDLTGAEFVYPKAQRTLVASAATPGASYPAPRRTSPAPSSAEPPSVAPREPVAESREEPAQTEIQAEEPVVIAQAQPPGTSGTGATQAQPAPTRQPASSGQEQEELPQTATSLTMASLLGGLAVCGGTLLRKLSRRLA